MELIFATSNLNKLREAQAILGKDFSLLSAADMGIGEEIPEEGESLKENALFKANYLFSRLKRDCFADDTGLEVEALNGAPGVRTARYASQSGESSLNMAKLLKELEGKENRQARFYTAIALIIKGESYLFEGILKGTIATKKSGERGFGYDPLFIPEGYTKTLAELSDFEKNIISHRAIAMRRVANFLQNLP